MQASLLESLRLALIEDGYSDVTYFIVNMKGVGSTNLLSDIVSFPVYQDTASLNIWSLLNGIKDDILIYDRCGQLTYQVRCPLCYIPYGNVERAIRVTSDNEDPCECDQSDDATTNQAMTTEVVTSLQTEV